jgi:2,3-bisphosphoglycerate-dependent phosphoglycerate mutase
MSKLVMVRHAESVYNKQGLWAGITDVELSEHGIEEAKLTGKQINSIDESINWQLYLSPLKRTQQTAIIAVKSGNLNINNIVISPALIERDYGIYTGMNKWDMKEKLGEEKFLELRRSFDYPIEGGESLKQVVERVIPFYKSNIEPLLQADKDILIIAHGNSLRAMIKYIENISDEGIAHVEMETGKPRIYDNLSGVLTRVIHE